MMKNVEHRPPKPKMQHIMSCFLPTKSPQPKDIQFTVMEDKKNQKTFTFETLESQNFCIFYLKNNSK